MHRPTTWNQTRRMRLNNSTPSRASSSLPEIVPGQFEEQLAGAALGHEQPVTGMAAHMPPISSASLPIGSLQRLLLGLSSSFDMHGLESLMSHSTGMPLQPVGVNTNATSLDLSQSQQVAFQEIGSTRLVDKDPILPQVDPPSGPMLLHRNNVRSDGPDDVDPMLDPADDEEPGHVDGRGCTKCVDEQPLKVNRIYITISLNSKSFDQPCANKSISALLRKLYRGDTKWENVSKQTRDKLWFAFCMRFWWDDDILTRVVELWYYLNRNYFVTMMSHAKIKWKYEHMRENWCAINYFYKLDHYWKRADVQEVALRNSKNRGVEYDTHGKVVKEVVATFTGGSKSGVKRDSEILDKQEGPKVGVLMGNYMKTRMSTGVKKKRKRGDKRAENTAASSQVDPAVAYSEEPRWINTTSEQTYELYNKLIDEKYRDRPQEKPSLWDPRDEECWAVASGGLKKGKVLGVSKSVVLEKFGYTNVMGRMPEGAVQLHTEGSVQKLIEAVSLKHKEEALACLEQQRLSLTEQFSKDRQAMLSDFNLDRERFQSQLSTTQALFERTSKQVEALMSRSLSHTPEGSGS